MLFRPETSLIPSVIALSGFFIDNFPHIYCYPYWYLGNPFHYLIGPVTPGLLMIFTGIAPFSLYYLYLGLIVMSVLVGGIGIYLFVREWDKEDQRLKIKDQKLSERETTALFSGLLYVLLPFSWLSLYYQNGLKMVAFAIIPFVFIVFRRFLIEEWIHHKGTTHFVGSPAYAGMMVRRVGYYFLLVFLIAVCLLITINVLLPLIVGVVAIFITVERLLNRVKIPPAPFNKGGEGGFTRNDSALWAWREEKIGKTIAVFFLALALATFWYTPRFWFVLLTNPSLGGVPLWNLIVNLFQAALNFLPLVLAILVLKWRTLSPKNLREIGVQGPVFFAFLFFFSFLILTIVRLLADPKFVIDWIGFLPELQFGAGILLSAILVRMRYLRFLGYLIVVFFAGISSLLIYNIFFYSKSDYQKQILNIFQPHLRDKNARVFLSGSDVFWINSYLSLLQVRGGNDGGSVHPYWSHGAYQIREGENDVLAEDWLKIFGSSYILVHKADSSDPFHDFKHPEKFKSLELLADKNGDMLYKIPKASIARIADTSILGVQTPRSGSDEKRVGDYVGKFKRAAAFNYLSVDTISVKGNIGSREVINLALTYDPSWKFERGNGRIVADSLGNLVILPSSSGEQEFVLKYERGNEDWEPLLVMLLIGAFLWKYKYIYPRLRRLMPRIHLGLGKE